MSDPLQGSVILLYGPPGCGKTQVAASFPSPFFIGGPSGKRYLSAALKKRFLRIKREDGWEVFLAFTEKLKKTKIKTVVIDLATDLYDSCFHAFCQEHSVGHPEEAGAHGRGWSKLRQKWFDGMADLYEAAAEIEATILLIAHSKILDIDMVSQPANQVTTDLPKQVNDLVTRASDHCWYLGYAHDDETPDRESLYRYEGDAPRVLVMKGSSEVYGKSQDPEMAIAYINPLPKTKQYAYIVKQINKAK